MILRMASLFSTKIKIFLLDGIIFLSKRFGKQ